MRYLAGMCHAPAPPHHRLLQLANYCRALCPNSTSPTLRNRTSDPLPTFHPLPTRFPSLSPRTFHPFVVSTPALSNSSHVFFHGVRETGLFTHARATLNFTIISMWHPRCRSAMSMRCRAGMCHAPSPPHHRLLPRAKSCRALCPNPTAPTFRNPTSDPDTLSILSLLACHPLLTHFSSLFRRTSHHFVVSTPALSNSNHVSFHGVRTKTFSTHVTT